MAKANHATSRTPQSDDYQADNRAHDQGHPPSPAAKSRSHVSIGAVCDLLSVSRSTVQRMVDMGVLTSMRTLGGHRRILLGSVHDYIASRQGYSMSTSSPRGAEFTPTQIGSESNLGSQHIGTSPSGGNSAGKTHVMVPHSQAPSHVQHFNGLQNLRREGLSRLCIDEISDI